MASDAEIPTGASLSRSGRYSHNHRVEQVVARVQAFPINTCGPPAFASGPRRNKNSKYIPKPLLEAWGLKSNPPCKTGFDCQRSHARPFCHLVPWTVAGMLAGMRFVARNGGLLIATSFAAGLNVYHGWRRWDCWPRRVFWPLPPGLHLVGSWW